MALIFFVVIDYRQREPEGTMSLTPQDLQAIKGLFIEFETHFDEKIEKLETKLLAELYRSQAEQTKEIAQVINQALSTVDDIYATKTELAEVRQKVALIERQLALG